VKSRRVMINNETASFFFENLRMPPRLLIEEEGKGFRYILGGMNASASNLAEGCYSATGGGFIDKATGEEREVFRQPIGQNQGIQFPLRRRTRGSNVRPRRFHAPAFERPGLGPRRTWHCSLPEAGLEAGNVAVMLNLRRLRLRRRATSSTSSARQALPGSPDLDEPHPLRRRARPGVAEGAGVSGKGEANLAGQVASCPLGSFEPKGGLFGTALTIFSGGESAGSPAFIAKATPDGFGVISSSIRSSRGLRFYPGCDVRVVGEGERAPFVELVQPDEVPAWAISAREKPSATPVLSRSSRRDRVSQPLEGFEIRSSEARSYINRDEDLRVEVVVGLGHPGGIGPCLRVLGQELRLLEDLVETG